MTALWLNLRVNAARWGFVPLTILGVAVLFGRSRFWIGIWPESGAAAQVSAFFLSMFGAGVAAWITAWIEVRGLREQAASAAIRPLSIELTRFTATLLWLLAPYLAVVAIAFTATAVTLFPPGVGAFFAYVVLGSILIVLGTAWGWLVGRLLSPLVAAVCGALSWFIIASLLQSADAIVMSGPPWLEVQLGQVGLRLATVFLFAVAVCMVPCRSGRLSQFGQRVAVAIAAFVVVFGAHQVTTVISYRDPIAQPLCVQGEIEYCLWPEHAKYVPMVEAVDQRVADLPIQLALPEKIVDYALSGSTQWVGPDMAIALEGTFPPEFDISEGSQWALARGVASAITSEVFAECESDASRDLDSQRNQLFAWLEWRLAGGGAPDYQTNAPAQLEAAWSTGHRSAAELSEQEQVAWVLTIIEEKERHCRVT